MEAITIDRWGRALQGIYTYQLQELGATVLPGAANGNACVMQATVYVTDDDQIVIGPEVRNPEEQDRCLALVLWQLPQDGDGWVPIYTGADVLAYSQDAVLARLDWNDYLIVQSRDDRAQLLLDQAFNIWHRDR